MQAMSHGHQDHSSRRPRVQNEASPFGVRCSGSVVSRRRVRRSSRGRRQPRGWLRGRGLRRVAAAFIAGRRVHRLSHVPVRTRLDGTTREPELPVRTGARRGLWVAAILLLIIGAILFERLTGVTPFVRDQVVGALNARFASQVELSSLQVSVFPRPEVLGEGVILRHNGRRDVPPLLTVPSFSATAGLLGLRAMPLRLKTVVLEGLEISIPAGGLDPGNNKGQRASDGVRITPPPPPDHPASHGTSTTLLVDLLVARTAALEIASKDPTKLPRRFDIHDLEMRHLGEASGAPFRAALTNPKPHGRIETEGTFGPWHADDPRLTPIRGDYLFGNANLDTIKGIGGTLASGGRYNGVLERIEVVGHTETPDFVIDIAGQPMPLTTTFEAVVDGTNGNTWLERVEATLRQTTIVARGAVVRAREVKGRQIALDVTIDGGRLEDLLALAVKSTRPPVTGAVALRARLVLPAGEEDVVDKLQLNGEFQLARARFTNLNVQNRVNTLSRRGQGDPGPEEEGESAVSNLRGRFVMRGGTIRFSDLTFAVPGATVQIAGAYNLRSEAIDFAGHLLLDATLAEMTTGFKAVAARIAQPLFRRPGGGSKLPIRISGTRSKPAFGLDIKRALTPG